MKSVNTEKRTIENQFCYNMRRVLDSTDDVLDKVLSVDRGGLHVLVVRVARLRALRQGALCVDAQQVRQRPAERLVLVGGRELVREALVQLVHLALLRDVQRLEVPRKHLQEAPSKRGYLAHDESFAQELWKNKKEKKNQCVVIMCVCVCIFSDAIHFTCTSFKDCGR